jgi:hypothetical protein
MIVECIKDADNTIRRRALDLVYCLVNDSNVQVWLQRLLFLTGTVWAFVLGFLPNLINLDPLLCSVRPPQVLIICYLYLLLPQRCTLPDSESSVPAVLLWSCIAGMQAHCVHSVTAA